MNRGRPERIRVRLRAPAAEDAVAIALPARSMRAASLFLFASSVIFAAIGWTAVAGMFGRQIDDVFDLLFLLFQGFWALGWSVGVLLLGALTILFAFYSESARLENGMLVYMPRLGPLQFLIDYDLAKVSSIRLEQVGSDPDNVQIRFNYDGRSNGLGNAMSRVEGQRVVDVIAAAARFVPRTPETLEAPHIETRRSVDPPRRAPVPARDVPLASRSVIALLAANLIPVAGVLFFGWDLGNIMVLYWAESGVVGFYTAMKIAVVGKLAAVVAVPFFIGHFGGFMTVHFLLIYGLFLRHAGWQPIGAGEALLAVFAPIWGSIAALFISHGMSFYTNFMKEREYEGASVSGLMTAPYQRIMLMHVTLILGGWIILLIGVPTGSLIVLLLFKTAADLQAHRREHTAAATRAARNLSTRPS